MESNDNLNCLDLAYSISYALVHRTQYTQYKHSNTLINYIPVYMCCFYSGDTFQFEQLCLYAHMHKVYEFFFVILGKNY